MKKIIAIIVICLTIFGSCYYASKNFNKAEHSISVQWDGEVYVVPDTLILSFRVEETAPTTAEAQKNANEKIDKLGLYTYLRSDPKLFLLKTPFWIFNQFMCNALGTIIFNLRWEFWILSKWGLALQSSCKLFIE